MSTLYINITLQTTILDEELTAAKQDELKNYIYKKLTNYYDPTYVYFDVEFKDSLEKVNTNTDDLQDIEQIIRDAYAVVFEF